MRADRVTLHPVRHPKWNRNHYCGPAAISAITGCLSTEAAAALRQVSGKRATIGVGPVEMAVALLAFGYLLEPVMSGPALFRHWHAEMRERGLFKGGAVYLVGFDGHWSVQSGRRYVCSNTREVVLTSAAMKDRWWHLVMDAYRVRRLPRRMLVSVRVLLATDVPRGGQLAANFANLITTTTRLNPAN